MALNEVPPLSRVILMFILTSHISGFRWFIYSIKKQADLGSVKGQIYRPVGIALLRLSTWDWCHHKGHSAVHWSCNSPMTKTSQQRSTYWLVPGFQPHLMVLTTEVPCYFTAELSPFADEDYETQLKAPEKLLFSISRVHLYFLSNYCEWTFTTYFTCL